MGQKLSVFGRNGDKNPEVGQAAELIFIPAFNKANFLNDFPSEILLEILNNLDMKDLLALRLASPGLKAWLLTNAHLICNRMILERHPRAAEILMSKYEDGWLVPGHDLVYRADQLEWFPFDAGSPSISISPYLTPTPAPTTSKIYGTQHLEPRTLGAPGPQYLYLLQEHGNLIVRLWDDYFVFHRFVHFQGPFQPYNLDVYNNYAATRNIRDNYYAWIEQCVVEPTSGMLRYVLHGFIDMPPSRHPLMWPNSDFKHLARVALQLEEIERELWWYYGRGKQNIRIGERFLFPRTIPAFLKWRTIGADVWKKRLKCHMKQVSERWAREKEKGMPRRANALATYSAWDEVELMEIR